MITTGLLGGLFIDRLKPCHALTGKYVTTHRQAVICMMTLDRACLLAVCGCGYYQHFIHRSEPHTAGCLRVTNGQNDDDDDDDDDDHDDDDDVVTYM